MPAFNVIIDLDGLEPIPRYGARARGPNASRAFYPPVKPRQRIIGAGEIGTEPVRTDPGGGRSHHA